MNNQGSGAKANLQNIIKGNIYANKSSRIIEWLLTVGIYRKTFSLREVARDQNVSVGLTQKVFSILTENGYLLSQGTTTSKAFTLKKPSALLDSWLNHYSLLNKCTLWTYSSPFSREEARSKLLESSKASQAVTLALHTAAANHQCQYTTLDTLECYLLDPFMRAYIEDLLKLTPQEIGYQVLLIDPYYKHFQLDLIEKLHVTSPLLTFLDLYHFPLRGQEQAEYMIRKTPILDTIYKR